jgi:hypothetical protein
MHQTRDPIHTTDHDGQAIVLVPLANHATPARMFPGDYAEMRREGFSGLWTLNQNGSRGYSYVRCAHARASGRLLTVARIIAGAEAGRIVKYHDGDRLNLRRDNLYLTGGLAFGRECSVLRNQANLSADCPAS